MLEVGSGRALAAPASRRSAAASTADGSEARKPAASRGPGACTVLYRYRRISGYPTIRDIRRLFYGIWIYLDHPHQLSVSTRWQNGHYPVNPDCAGANRIHALTSKPRPNSEPALLFFFSSATGHQRRGLSFCPQPTALARDPWHTARLSLPAKRLEPAPRRLRPLCSCPAREEPRVCTAASSFRAEWL